MPRHVFPQHALLASILYHLLPGVGMTLFHSVTAPRLFQLGLPAVWGLLLGTLFIIIPLELGLLLYAGKQQTGRVTLRGILDHKPLPMRQFLWLIPLVFLASAILPGLGVAIEPWLRTEVFGWLPAWYSPSPAALAGATPALWITTAMLWFVSQVIAGPIVEELYFRGYLLPRVAYLGRWAPLFNAGLFALYHFWQPHALLTILLTSLPLAYAVWWKHNLYPSIIAHCSVNLLTFVLFFSGMFSR